MKACIDCRYLRLHFTTSQKSEELATHHKQMKDKKSTDKGNLVFI